MKKKTKTAIAIYLITFVTVIAIAVYFNNTKQEKPKVKPEEYFEFSDIAAFARNSTTQKAILIEMLHFNLTPIGGDANHVVIFTEGMTNPEDYYYLKIQNSTTETVDITFTSPIMSIKQDEGYPIKIRIRSDEAEGYVIIFIKPEDVITQGS